MDLTHTDSSVALHYNLQAKNDKYKALITALEGVTGLKTEEEVEEPKQDKK